MTQHRARHSARLMGMCCSIAILILLAVRFAVPIQAQEVPSKPLEIELSLDRSSMRANDTCQALLVIRNTSCYTVTNIGARLIGENLGVETHGSLATVISPYSSASTEYTLRGTSVGSHNVVFEMQYSWSDQNTGMTHHSTETIHAGSIEVLPRLNFNWPNYVIPLVLGFVMGQVGSWLADRHKYQKEQLEQEEQVQHVTLSILKTSLEGVKKKEQVPFALWSEVVIKGHLSPALHRLCRRIGNAQLSQKLAELTITLEVYNRRQTNDTLEPDFVAKLVENLQNMIREFEKTCQDIRVHRRLYQMLFLKDGS